MAGDNRTVLDQLEDSLLRVAPIAGGLIGALVGAGVLKNVVPPIVACVAGGAVGGVVVFAILYGFFLVINPNRDRKKKKS